MTAQRVTPMHYTIREAADVLHLTPQAVRDRIARNEIRRAALPGRIWYIPAAELKRLAPDAVPGHEDVESGSRQHETLREIQRLHAQRQAIDAEVARLLAELEG